MKVGLIFHNSHTPSVLGRCIEAARMVRGRTKEKNERSFSRSKSRCRKGKEECWYCSKKDISRNIKKNVGTVPKGTSQEI
jgi:hypothetical protein